MSALVEPLDAVLDRAPESWQPIVDAWRLSPAGRQLVGFVEGRREQGARIYPADVLRALFLTPRPAVRVVILGQDPYHRPGQAEGLAFSVPVGQAIPPSLRNIFKELRRDLGLPLPPHGHLAAWARQGVLLLNSTLTVEDGAAAAHARQGWEALTGRIVELLAEEDVPRVFMLWGAHAGAHGAAIAGRHHCVLASNHPSPLSALRPPSPFIGNGHFGAANRFLESHGVRAVDWRVT